MKKNTRNWNDIDKMILSMKNLVFKERLAKKLVDQYISLYIINKVISANEIKLQLATSIRIYLVVNVSQVVRYREQVEKKKIKKVKPVEVDEVKEWKVEKILNKRKIRRVIKFLVCWKC